MEILQRVACKAIIVKNGKALLLREASTYLEGTNIGKYGFPGGRINLGEPFVEGLKREVMEETGLEVEVGKPLYVDEWFPEIKGVKNHIVAIFFECKPLGENIKLSEEHDDYRWISPEEASKFNIMKAAARALKACV